MVCCKHRNVACRGRVRHNVDRRWFVGRDKRFGRRLVCRIGRFDKRCCMRRNVGDRDQWRCKVHHKRLGGEGK